MFSYICSGLGIFVSVFTKWKVMGQFFIALLDLEMSLNFKARFLFRAESITERDICKQYLLYKFHNKRT